MKKATGHIAKQIAALRRMKDEDIDLTDIPEITDWGNAVVGKFYRPIKQSLTIRVDADVLAWLRSQGKGYQTRINGLLRRAMESARTHGKTPKIKETQGSGYPQTRRRMKHM